MPRLTAEQAEQLLLRAGFQYVRCKGSHKIYQRAAEMFVVPCHTGRVLHPKITKDLIEMIGKNSGA
ncbi:type II toxin-antitoxin system HicA family toxin [Thiospirillum jenense]|nr:type II toxin-antitoxin system HicA family toxin [Thiospirillum jenense]